MGTTAVPPEVPPSARQVSGVGQAIPVNVPVPETGCALLGTPLVMVTTAPLVLLEPSR
jgi:hypothetical protein